MQLPEQLNQQQARDLYSAVLSAVADLDISETQGREKFLNDIFMKEVHYDFVEQWLASEKATPWLEGRDRVNRENSLDRE